MRQRESHSALKQRLADVVVGMVARVVLIMVGAILERAMVEEAVVIIVVWDGDIASYFESPLGLMKTQPVLSPRHYYYDNVMSSMYY